MPKCDFCDNEATQVAMGYRTDFSVSFEVDVPEGSPGYGAACNDITKQEVNDCIIDKAFLEFFDEFPGNVYGCGKWHECDEDMRLISHMYPQYLFTIEAHGEVSEDIWCAFYKGGVGYREAAQIVYPAYSIEKME